MSIAWYVIPYKRESNRKQIIRYPAIDDYTQEINSSGGKWAEIEISGDRAIVKVRASKDVLDKLDIEFERHTKQEILGLVTQTRKKPRYDSVKDQIIFDGEDIPCKPLSIIDEEVK